MPNWCSNTVLIEFRGNVEAKNFFTNLINMYREGGIDRMANTLESKLWTESIEHASKDDEDGWAIGGKVPGLLNMLAPLDENSYELNCEKWGTKWDIPAREIYESLTDDSCQISFFSAWSPPVEALKILGDRLDKVGSESVHIHIDYSEPGMYYMGYDDKSESGWDSDTRTIDEVYKSAKAGDKDALEFIANCGTCLEDMEDDFNLGEPDEDECCSCGDTSCDDLNHLISDNKDMPDDLKVALSNFRDMLDAHISEQIRKIGDNKE